MQKNILCFNKSISIFNRDNLFNTHLLIDNLFEKEKNLKLSIVLSTMVFFLLADAHLKAENDKLRGGEFLDHYFFVLKE